MLNALPITIGMGFCPDFTFCCNQAEQPVVIVSVNRFN